MVMEALVLALSQAGAADVPDVPVCSLVTPRGDAVGFFVAGDENPDRILLSPTPGSAWPARTIVGVRQAPLQFAIGERDGFVLELRPDSTGRFRRSATLFLRHNRHTSLPAAFGFCEDRRAPGEPTEVVAEQSDVGANDAAFDPAHWPQHDCGLILSDGRRGRFDFTLTQGDQVRLASAELWSGHPVTVRIQWRNANDVQLGTFGRDGGPDGVQMMFVDGARAVKLVRLQQLGDPSAPQLTGYAICGYNQIVRRRAD